jgi:predicted secreted protein
MNFSKYAPILSFFIIFMASCSEIEVKNEYPAINEVKSGAKFRIVLPEDHRTGYNWQLSQDYNTSAIHQINEVWHGNDKGIYFHLEARALGETKLTFISRKYTDTADIKHFIVKIVNR